jgi:hypothetical protein
MPFSATTRATNGARGSTSNMSDRIIRRRASLHASRLLITASCKLLRAVHSTPGNTLARCVGAWSGGGIGVEEGLCIGGAIVLRAVHSAPGNTLAPCPPVWARGMRGRGYSDRLDGVDGGWGGWRRGAMCWDVA